MKLYELLEVLDEDVEIWLNVGGVESERYKSRKDVDESYNRCPVWYVTLDSENVLTIEI